MAVHILTDSSHYLDPAVVAELGIHVLPLTLQPQPDWARRCRSRGSRLCGNGGMFPQRDLLIAGKGKP